MAAQAASMDGPWSSFGKDALGTKGADCRAVTVWNNCISLSFVCRPVQSYSKAGIIPFESNSAI